MHQFGGEVAAYGARLRLRALLAEAGQVNFDAAGKIGCFVA